MLNAIPSTTTRSTIANNLSTTTNSTASLANLTTLPTPTPPSTPPSLKTHNNCTPQPPTTIWTFYTSPSIHSASTTATTPPLYTPIFTTHTASYVGTSYLGHTELPTYNTTTCAHLCTASTPCRSFNIYYERAPALDPECDARSVIKCALWAERLDVRRVTNGGYEEGGFEIVIAGSNGYEFVGESSGTRGRRRVGWLGGLGVLVAVVLG
ncbi:hypothetical protein BDW02DRAFT_595553 [Decorospora gaudefroyi]|uniref:Apple domain-containing protein n=1 Tax=Decorospora gaudefroyi TaxID=184978 RepID=A0A6A5KMP5_9PLEO|nr:hypothetical protein BDW02DRAFT_595553 [Decorospora gaudefroyi]